MVSYLETSIDTNFLYRYSLELVASYLHFLVSIQGRPFSRRNRVLFKESCS